MCEGVRFEVLEEPLSAGYCHCTRCQRRTGTAASAQARLAPDSFRLLAGEEWSWCYADEVALLIEEVSGETRIPPSPLLQ